MKVNINGNLNIEKVGDGEVARSKSCFKRSIVKAIGKRVSADARDII